MGGLKLGCVGRWLYRHDALDVQVMERLRDLGVLIGKGGLAGNVFRIKPPMCLTRADADFLVDALDHALGEL